MTGMNTLDEARQPGLPGIVLSSDGLGVILPRRYMTILADPPWSITTSGRRSSKRARGGHGGGLPYPTMSLNDIKALPVGA